MLHCAYKSCVSTHASLNSSQHILRISSVCHFILPVPVCLFGVFQVKISPCGLWLDKSLHHHLMPEATEHYVQAPAMTTTPLAFAVRRREPVLVGPAAPTPRETKRLSDIDDQETLRGHVPFLFLYRGGGGARADDGRDPASAVRRALGEALVPYYPLAGRLREVEARKLVVDCTGEGVMFVEADADVRLAELEAASSGELRPPFPCMDQLLFDVDGSGGVLNCPLLLIQVGTTHASLLPIPRKKINKALFSLWVKFFWITVVFLFILSNYYLIIY